MDVALASCLCLPEPDFDQEPLLAALARAGLEARVVAWDDPDADFAAARLTLLRATWNYPRMPNAFLDWASRTASVSALWNPLPVVRWNHHKRYLFDLERAGIAVTPTALVPQGAPTRLAGVLAERGWTDVVVKPAISAGSYRTLRCGLRDADEGEAHLRALVADGDALVQPYLTSVEDYGERAIVVIDGAISHAVRKSPRFHGHDESVTPAMPISDAERLTVEAILRTVPSRLLYARIDLAPGPDGGPLVMEVELIEPSLFFPHQPRAADRLALAVRRECDRGGR